MSKKIRLTIDIDLMGNFNDDEVEGIVDAIERYQDTYHCQYRDLSKAVDELIEEKLSDMIRRKHMNGPSSSGEWNKDSELRKRVTKEIADEQSSRLYRLSTYKNIKQEVIDDNYEGE
jgi:hypothetical protein